MSSATSAFSKFVKFVSKLSGVVDVSLLMMSTRSFERASLECEWYGVLNKIINNNIFKLLRGKDGFISIKFSRPTENYVGAAVGLRLNDFLYAQHGRDLIGGGKSLSVSPDTIVREDHKYEPKARMEPRGTV